MGLLDWLLLHGAHAHLEPEARRRLGLLLLPQQQVRQGGVRGLLKPLLSRQTPNGYFGHLKSQTCHERAKKHFYWFFKNF